MRTVISGAKHAPSARPESEIAFADNAKAFDAAAGSRAGCLVVPAEFDGSWNMEHHTRKPPRSAFARAAAALYAQPAVAAGVHATAVIDPAATVSLDASIEAYVTVGAGATIAANCSIGAGCRIGERVEIGEGSTLHPNVTIYPYVRIGRRVVLHSGCVIGADGFG